MGTQRVLMTKKGKTILPLLGGEGWGEGGRFLSTEIGPVKNFFTVQAEGCSPSPSPSPPWRGDSYRRLLDVSQFVSAGEIGIQKN